MKDRASSMERAPSERHVRYRGDAVGAAAVVSLRSAPRLARDLFVALMVSFPTPDNDSAWRGSVGRFGPAPRLARILFLLLMMSFADAQQCATTCIGAPRYASDCACATEFASNEFATEYGYDFISVNGVSSHGSSLTNGPMNVQVADETAQLVDTFSISTFGAVQACTRGSLETLKARVAAKSLSNMTSTGAKVDPTLHDVQTTLSIISYLGGLLETDAFKANNTIDIVEAAHETAPDSMPYARSSTMGASLVAMAPALLPGMLATLGLLCAVLYGAVQAFSARGASALASIMGPPPPEGRRAVSAASPTCRPSARRGSAGRFGSAPRLVGVLFLTLMVGFASAQTCTETAATQTGSTWLGS
eukprot:jgi/Chrpa1/21770/Chrysochromulina_OHIO_Genome00024642-RA